MPPPSSNLLVLLPLPLPFFSAAALHQFFIGIATDAQPRRSNICNNLRFKFKCLSPETHVQHPHPRSLSCLPSFAFVSVKWRHSASAASAVPPPPPCSSPSTLPPFWPNIVCHCSNFNVSLVNFAFPSPLSANMLGEGCKYSGPVNID